MTEDLKERLSQHNGKFVPFTSRGTPWILVHYQAFIEKEDAIREEKFLKTGKGRERRKYLLKDFIDRDVNLWRSGRAVEGAALEKP